MCLISCLRPCDTIQSYLRIPSLWSSHMYIVTCECILAHTQTLWINLAGPPDSPEATTTVGVESRVKFLFSFSQFCAYFTIMPKVEVAATIYPYTMAVWNRKIQFYSDLWGLMFTYDVLLLTCCWKAGTFEPAGSVTWQKHVFALSGSVGRYYYVWWCGTILVSVSSHCVCCTSRAGRTVFHVSLIRLSLAGPAASTELRRAAQQGHHSTPTKPALLPPKFSRLPPRVAARHSDGVELNQS